MRTYRFYKDEYGWFIDLKWFHFNRAYLAMVCGADELLDKLSENNTEVILQLSTKSFSSYSKNKNILERVQKLGLFNGAIYEVIKEKHHIKNEIFKPNQLWLCAVTLLVFGYYPKEIYFAVKN